MIVQREKQAWMVCLLLACFASSSQAHVNKCRNLCKDDTFRPICGSNGQTYKNHCQLRVAACTSGREVTKVVNGPCGPIEDPCKGVVCPYRGMCVAVGGKLKCDCQFPCKKNISWVCASNGRNYPTSCIMRMWGCINRQHLKVVSDDD